MAEYYPSYEDYPEGPMYQSSAEDYVKALLVTTTTAPPAFLSIMQSTARKTTIPLLIGKVIGGDRAWNGQFPHQVSLQDHARGHFCGASVIHPLLVLTAAHCLANVIPTDIQAVTGAHDLRNAGARSRNVVHAIRHEKYNDTSWENDIAILVLNESLVFDNFTKPIEIYERGVTGKKGAYVSGWGQMEDHLIADVLQFAVIGIPSDRSRCRQLYAGLEQSRVITDSMICAGGSRADSCHGDSGGPLLCFQYSVKKNPDQLYLCGIVSFGVGCKTRHPGIYTDVSKYYGWIQKHMHTWSQQHYMTSLGKPLFEGAQCGPRMFRCKNSGVCIPEEFRCDGVNDCDPLTTGNYDEKDCPSITCPSGKFRCDNSTCLPFHLVCDGKPDCHDHTDEICV